MQINKNQSEVIIKALNSVGFSPEQADRQVFDLGKLISMTVLERFLKEKPEIKNLSTDDIEEFMKENFEANYIEQVFKEESGKLVDEYFKAITQELSQEKKFELIKQLDELNN